MIEYKDTLKCTETIKEFNEENTEFKKFDSGKSRVDLIDPKFLLGIGKILSLGAMKYGEDNWKSCEDPERYYGAIFRHILESKMGVTEDHESGEDPLLHAAASLMFYYVLKNKED